MNPETFLSSQLRPPGATMGSMFGKQPEPTQPLSDIGDPPAEPHFDEKEEPPMSEQCSDATSRQLTEMNALNSKLAYDSAAQLQNQSFLDNQSDARAWAEFKLESARDSQRLKHLGELNLLVSAQVGQTEDDQTTSPGRTGTPETAIDAVGTANAQVAANIADLATSLVPVIASALAAAISQTLAALVPVVVNASGGASTPSQTTSKPAA